MIAQKSSADALRERYNALSAVEREQLEVYAVAAGANVTYSSFWHNADRTNTNYLLDNHYPPSHAWQSRSKDLGEWIQVSQEYPKLWTGVIMQGRGDYDQWVKSIKIAYTLNGKLWDYVQNGKVFQANSDRNTKVRILFNPPIYARALRIYPQEWHGSMSLRFDAVYVDLE